MGTSGSGRELTGQGQAQRSVRLLMSRASRRWWATSPEMAVAASAFAQNGQFVQLSAKSMEAIHAGKLMSGDMGFFRMTTPSTAGEVPAATAVASCGRCGPPR